LTRRRGLISIASNPLKFSNFSLFHIRSPRQDILNAGFSITGMPCYFGREKGAREKRSAHEVV
jgi:hypothetical protein